ncbi:hypothetical protein ShzoTeo12_53760 (plasmid) [Shinella zoogloeoides]|nr:hypothetical protein ShzoTeo12_53760 [Shinella zoogloeoides]
MGSYFLTESRHVDVLIEHRDLYIVRDIRVP